MQRKGFNFTKRNKNWDWFFFFFYFIYWRIQSVKPTTWGSRGFVILIELTRPLINRAVQQLVPLYICYIMRLIYHKSQLTCCLHSTYSSYRYTGVNTEYLLPIHIRVVEIILHISRRAALLQNFSRFVLITYDDYFSQL